MYISPQDALVPLTSSVTVLQITVLIQLWFFFRLNQRGVSIRMTGFSTYYTPFSLALMAELSTVLEIIKSGMLDC
jgi:hypothetical protein